MKIEQVMGGVFDQYDAIADELMQSEVPNLSMGVGASNAEMAEYIKKVYNTDHVDVLGEYNFDEVIAGEDGDKIVACSFIALLRYQTFSKAREDKVGIIGITVTAQAYAEYWYLRFKDKMDVMADPDKQVGWWLH